MFVPPIIGRCAINYNASMPRQCEPDVNFEASTVAMVVWCDDLHAATRNSLIVRFESIYFAHDL